LLLYAYGSHGTIARPGYNEVFCGWLSHFHNSTIAIACCRGGGELGEKWHRSGMRDKKQNSIDDLIYATKWLHAENYTSPSKTVLLGKSAGGLLVAAAMNQEPSLYRCVVPWVGVLVSLPKQYSKAVAACSLCHLGFITLSYVWIRIRMDI
jgi:prolyl oligopeptidase